MNIPPILTRVFVTASLTLLAGWLAAQESSGLIVKNVSEIELRLAALENRTDLTEEQRLQLSESYTQCKNNLLETRRLEAETDELKKTAENSPAVLQKLGEELKSVQIIEAQPIAANATQEELVAQSEANTRKIDNLTEQIKSLDADLLQIRTQPEEFRKELERLMGTRQELERKLEPLPTIPQNELQAAIQSELFTHQEAVNARVSWLETSLQTREVREQFLEARKKIRVEELEMLKVHQGRLNQRIDAIRMSKASATRSQAQAVSRDPEADQSLKKEAEINERFSAELIKATREARNLRGNLVNRELELSEIKEAAGQIRLILGIPNLPATYAEQLRQDRNRIVPWRVLEREAQRRHENDSARRLLQLEVRKAKQDLNGRLRSEGIPEASAEPPSALMEMLQSREELLQQLTQVLDNAERTTSQLDLAETRIAAESLNLASMLDRKLLWIRSLKPVGSYWINEQEKGLQRLWADRPRYFGNSMEQWGYLRSKFLLILGGALFFGLLLKLTGRARKSIRDIGERTGRLLTDRFTFTTEALALTVLVSSALPLFLVALGFLIQGLPSGEIWQGLGYGLKFGAGLLFAFHLIREICRPGGLADKHFVWLESPRNTLFRAAGSARLILPALVALVFAANWNGEEWIRSGIGRVAFSMNMMLMAWYLRRLLRLPGGLLDDWAGKTSLWSRRLYQLFAFLAVVTPIMLLLLSLRGYYYSARQVAGHSLLTLVVIFSSIVFFNLTLRWLVVARRRYAINQARERRDAAKNNPRPDAAPNMIPGEERSIREELASIDTQTRKLLRMTALVLALAGLVAVWRPLLPALNALEDINWDTSGGKVITLWDITRGVMTIIVTIVGARNVPGMLEILIPASIPLSRSSRYALSALSRYVIVITGIILAFGIFGVGWHQVQWLAAAVTVGLGFGLQEIFANFVSGIIILFEQPIRVGDVVTVDNVSGTVTRIRIRATTITSWERKEFIVPNKEFVTGRLMNWTLSDSVNRVVLTVGVAYGTDLEKALKLLEQVAHDHPIVMDDPAPSVVFDQFGDNALTLTLRCYLPDMDDRMKTITEMHVAVDKAYREAGIEISFPQRDLHLRSLPPSLSEWLENQKRQPAAEKCIDKNT